MIDKNTLYKLPYKKNNNPSGWVEPTTHCQLKCPSCYRGTDKRYYKPVHRNIVDLKVDVNRLIKERNIQTLSIGGGEPLLYPDLDELVKYARTKDLNVIIYTNGILLDRKRLKELRDSGTTRIVIHVDKYQNRQEARTEENANLLRQKFCDLFREVNGITLGFIKYISNDNLKDLDSLISLYKKNADVLRLAVFTILRKSASDTEYKEAPGEMEIDSELVCNKVKELFGLEYCSYLAKTKSENIAWLIGYLLYRDNNLLGSVDKRIVELYQKENYRKEGRYSFVSNDSHYTLNFIFHTLLNKNVGKLLYQFLSAKGKFHLNGQFILIINSPDKENGEWDTCDGCPDAMFYNNELVPNCLLERIKSGEKVL
jgi:organic radical activating enzyme